jgi:hypothetical protein
MPWMVGDHEKHLAMNGFIVATHASREFKCSTCKGKLCLIRDLTPEGVLSPAVFRCDGCSAEVGIGPDKTGGVQPALNFEFVKSPAGKKFYHGGVHRNHSSDADDGGWR